MMGQSIEAKEHPWLQPGSGIVYSTRLSDLEPELIVNFGYLARLCKGTLREDKS